MNEELEIIMTIRLIGWRCLVTTLKNQLQKNFNKVYNAYMDDKKEDLLIGRDNRQ